MPLTTLLFAPLLFAPQSNDFAPTPEHRWANVGIALAIREGILPEYTNGLYRARLREIHSRFEFAIYVHGAISTQLDRTERVLGEGTDLQRASLLRARALVPFYRRAAQEFASEARQLGFDPEFGIGRLESLTMDLDEKSPARDRLFSDVPADHWAARAVGDLRALGLLDDYPDGSYRGK